MSVAARRLTFWLVALSALSVAPLVTGICVSARVVRDARVTALFAGGLAGVLASVVRGLVVLRHWRRTNAALVRREEQLRWTLEHAPTGIAMAALDGRVTQVNHALCEILGEPAATLLARDLAQLTHAGDDNGRERALAARLVRGEIPRYRVERRCVRADGVRIDLAARVALVRDARGAPRHLVAQVEDVTSLRHAQDLLAQRAEQSRLIAMTDELTGLRNRRGFAAHAVTHLARARESGTRAALLFIDLDGLKVVNDRLGHERGDEALRDMAAVMRATFRATDVLARLGGDEFAALLPGARHEALDEIIARLRAGIARHNATAARPFALSASVGVAWFEPARPASLDALMALADERMYAEKRARTSTRESTA